MKILNQGYERGNEEMANAKQQEQGLFYLITRGIAFSYTEKSGIVFEASASFVKRMSDALVTAYGCSLRPSINEVK